MKTVSNFSLLLIRFEKRFKYHSWCKSSSAFALIHAITYTDLTPVLKTKRPFRFFFLAGEDVSILPHRDRFSLEVKFLFG